MHILVVEDVATVAAVMEQSLKNAGMEVVCAGTGEAALAASELTRPDVVLIDLSLPDTDGMSLVSVFANQGCGVIVVTVTGEEESRVTALDIGADDYMVKPVMVQELAARIRAVHRRMQGRQQPQPATVKLGVDTNRRHLTGPDGRLCPLTEAEMQAFDALLDAAGQPVTREWISRIALKRPVHSEDRSVDQLVMKLRRKLSELGCPDRTILSVRREGYVMADPALFSRVTDERPS